MRYAAVDDVGRAVNPMILHGQAHGGIVQGAGQALFEHARYDPESGQMLAGSLMDYAIARADDFPFFDTEIMEVPSPTNPLGVRGGGEGEPRRRSPWWSTRSATRSPNTASATSKCLRRPSASGV